MKERKKGKKKLEKKNFEPKIRRIRELTAIPATTKTNLKLGKDERSRTSITIQHLQTSTVNTTMYVPFVWIDDYNDSIWNDTKFNTTHANVTIIPIKQEENLIFGYFRLYALILLAIFVILLLVITAIACYYDCENRRSSLPRDKYDSTKKGTVPTVTIKYAGEQSDIIDGKSIRVVSIYSFLTLKVMINIIQY
ncbi:hypothetical protein LOAG_13918 [Loa loa]|uniref:Uncharacterized protein n=1 Tax=Loa loa TaxID=7209 RepID=A0A1S0TIP6_LOALO|nr:hypothetical protein LOAG_13918 [Loa loa]EFO14599.2 hypothetical protein LOAG_13918 [Loa loa]